MAARCCAKNAADAPWFNAFPVVVSHWLRGSQGCMARPLSVSMNVAESSRPVRPLPGPPSILAPWAAVRFLTNPFAFLQSLTTRYGDVVGFRLGPVKYCLINRPDLIHEVLVARQAEFTKGAVLAHVAKSVMGNGLLSSEGDFHLRQRRLCQPAFDPQHLVRYAEVMVEAAADLSARWRDNEEIDLYDTISALSLSIAAQTLFGFNMQAQLNEFRTTYNEMQHGYSMLQLMVSVMVYKLGIQRHFSSRRGELSRKRLDEIVYGVIAAKQQAEEPGDDLLSHLIRATDVDGDGAGMDRQQLRDEAMTFILAGHDTIATSLTWTWELLSRHPAVEARLHAELDALAGDQPLTADDLPRLKYTSQVFLEAMRLYPAIWTIGRSATAEVLLDGYRIPAGCLVMVSPYVTQRDSRYFPDPLAFRPERWSEEAAPPELAYFPFGGGKRRCIGRSFALMEGPLVLATLARGWRMRRLDSQPADVRRGIVLKPRYPIRMRVERRSASPTAHQ
jgi:cytochrome P450